MKTIKQVGADIIHAIDGLCFLPCWWVQRLHKRDPHLWTFGAWDGLRYSDNSRALYEYVNAYCPQIKAVWMTHSPAIVQRLKDKGLPVALFESKEGRQIQKNAGFFITSNGVVANTDSHYMNGIYCINLWHGMPLKRIGNDMLLFERKNTLFKQFKTFCRRILLPWEFIKGPTLSSSPFFTPFLQSAFELPLSEVWETGLPRIDKFRSTAPEELIQALDEQFNHPLKVLYMPTHRDAEHHFNPFTKAGFCAATFNILLEQHNIVFLYKGHFCDRDVHEESLPQRLITLSDNDYDDLYTFVRDVDILITDYSSIYFDFLYLRKPIILFPFDEEAYITKSRPFYFDYALMEAKKVYSWQELIQCLATHDYQFPSNEEIERFCGIEQEKSHCEQVIEHILSMIK